MYFSLFSVPYGGLFVKEWKSSGHRTMRAGSIGPAVLVIFITGAGNYIREFE